MRPELSASISLKTASASTFFLAALCSSGGVANAAAQVMNSCLEIVP